MRDVDPQAVHAVNRIEQEYRRRFGVDLRGAHDLWLERARDLEKERFTGEAKTVDLKAMVDEHRPHYMKVADDQWRAQATLAEWVNAYGHARVLTGVDPGAEQAAQRIEGHVRDRFGVDLRIAFDDAMARQSGRLHDDASDLAQEAAARDAARFRAQDEAGGLDPDDPAVARLREEAAREEREADHLTTVAGDVAHDGTVLRGTATEAEVNEADRVARRVAPAYVPVDEANEESQQQSRGRATTVRSRQRKRGRAR